MSSTMCIPGTEVSITGASLTFSRTSSRAFVSSSFACDRPVKTRTRARPITPSHPPHHHVPRNSPNPPLYLAHVLVASSVRSGRDARAQVSLTNSGSQVYLFKVQTTNKDRYSVKPSHGLVRAGGNDPVHFKVSVDKAKCAKLIADTAGIAAAVKKDKFQLLLCPLDAPHVAELEAQLEANASKESDVLKKAFKAHRNKLSEIKVKLPPSRSYVQFNLVASGARTPAPTVPSTPIATLTPATPDAGGEAWATPGGGSVPATPAPKSSGSDGSSGVPLSARKGVSPVGAPARPASTPVSAKMSSSAAARSPSTSPSSASRRRTSAAEVRAAGGLENKVELMEAKDGVLVFSDSSSAKRTASASLQLSNTSCERDFVFKIQTNKKERWTTKPKQGLLTAASAGGAPSTVSIKITEKPPKDGEPLGRLHIGDHKFQIVFIPIVRSVSAAIEKMPPASKSAAERVDSISKLFKSAKKHEAVVAKERWTQMVDAVRAKAGGQGGLETLSDDEVRALLFCNHGVVSARSKEKCAATLARLEGWVSAGSAARKNATESGIEALSAEEVDALAWVAHRRELEGAAAERTAQLMRLEAEGAAFASPAQMLAGEKAKLSAQLGSFVQSNGNAPFVGATEKVTMNCEMRMVSASPASRKAAQVSSADPRSVAAPKLVRSEKAKSKDSMAKLVPIIVCLALVLLAAVMWLKMDNFKVAVVIVIVAVLLYTTGALKPKSKKPKAGAVKQKTT